jgi:hypothetical protein
MVQLGGMFDPNLGSTGIGDGVLETHCQLTAVRFIQRLGMKPIASVGGKDQEQAGEKRNSKGEIRNSKLENRNSKLENRNSKLEIPNS